MVELLTRARSTRPTRPDEISVDGIIIPRADIAREIQNHTAANPKEAFQSAARALVVRELLLAAAARLDVTGTPQADADGRRETEEEATIRALLEREVTVPKADTATCRRYFDQHRASFRTGDLCEVRHILFPAAPDDAEGRAAARSAAVDAIARIASGRETFEALARAHSACPSREVGGSLGQVGPGQTVPEFETALAAMTPGALHPEPVETRYGLHVVHLAHRVEGRHLPFEMVEEVIAGHLECTAWNIAVRQYLRLLAGRADIRGVALDGAASPLVQ